MGAGGRVGEGVSETVGDTDGEGVKEGEGVREGDGVREGVEDGVAVGQGPPPHVGLGVGEGYGVSEGLGERVGTALGSGVGVGRSCAKAGGPARNKTQRTAIGTRREAISDARIPWRTEQKRIGAGQIDARRLAAAAKARPANFHGCPCWFLMIAHLPEWLPGATARGFPLNPRENASREVALHLTQVV